VSTLCSGDYTQASGQTVSVRYWNGCKNATLQRVLRCTVATSTVVNEVCEASQRALCCAVANPGVQCGAVRSSVSGFSVSGFCLFRRGCSNPGVVLWNELLVTGCCEVNYSVVTFLLSKMVGVPPPGGGRGRKSARLGSGALDSRRLSVALQEVFLLFALFLVVLFGGTLAVTWT
jgi:hypothetical protein